MKVNIFHSAIILTLFSNWSLILVCFVIITFWFWFFTIYSGVSLPFSSVKIHSRNSTEATFVVFLSKFTVFSKIFLGILPGSMLKNHSKCFSCISSSALTMLKFSAYFIIQKALLLEFFSIAFLKTLKSNYTFKTNISCCKNSSHISSKEL